LPAPLMLLHPSYEYVFRELRNSFSCEIMEYGNWRARQCDKLPSGGLPPIPGLMAPSGSPSGSSIPWAPRTVPSPLGLIHSSSPSASDEGSNVSMPCDAAHLSRPRVSGSERVGRKHEKDRASRVRTRSMSRAVRSVRASSRRSSLIAMRSARMPARSSRLSSTAVVTRSL